MVVTLFYQLWTIFIKLLFVCVCERNKFLSDWNHNKYIFSICSKTYFYTIQTFTIVWPWLMLVFVINRSANIFEKLDYKYHMLFILTALTATFPRLYSLPTIKPMTLFSLIVYVLENGRKMVPRPQTGPRVGWRVRECGDGWWPRRRQL